jgi:zinc finger MYND domain-containing protein 15
MNHQGQFCAAGLAAYQSWAATLESLPRGVPALFTDYCEEAALQAAAMAAALTGAPLALPVSVNPFRRPASSIGRDNALPSLSNGFIFGLVCQPK